MGKVSPLMFAIGIGLYLYMLRLLCMLIVD